MEEKRVSRHERTDEQADLDVWVREFAASARVFESNDSLISLPLPSNKPCSCRTLGKKSFFSLRCGIANCRESAVICVVLYLNLEDQNIESDRFDQSIEPQCNI